MYGLMEVKSISGCSYFVTFIDNVLRIARVYTLKSKGNMLDIFKAFHVAVERETNKLLKCLISNNGSILPLLLMIILTSMSLGTRRRCLILPY